VFTAAVIVAFFGLIYSRISLDRSAFELDELTEAIAVEERRAHDLEAEQARLQDPARIGSLAVEMGMVYPLTRVALHAPENTDAEIDPDLRWAQLEGLLSARP
jgi:cell division protein FtsL